MSIFLARYFPDFKNVMKSFYELCSLSS